MKKLTWVASFACELIGRMFLIVLAMGFMANFIGCGDETEGRILTGPDSGVHPDATVNVVDAGTVADTGVANTQEDCYKQHLTCSGNVLNTPAWVGARCVTVTQVCANACLQLGDTASCIGGADAGVSSSNDSGVFADAGSNSEATCLAQVNACASSGSSTFIVDYRWNAQTNTCDGNVIETCTNGCNASSGVAVCNGPTSTACDAQGHCPTNYACFPRTNQCVPFSSNGCAYFEVELETLNPGSTSYDVSWWDQGTTRVTQGVTGAGLGGFVPSPLMACSATVENYPAARCRRCWTIFGSAACDTAGNGNGRCYWNKR